MPLAKGIETLAPEDEGYSEDEEPVSASGMPAIEGPEDIDPNEWLAHDDSTTTDHVFVQMGDREVRLKIAAITEAEDNVLLKASRKFDPKTKSAGKIDFSRYRKLVVAYSLSKAQGTEKTPQAVNPDALGAKLTGHLTVIQKAIMKVSGMDMDESTPAADPSSFFD